MKELPPQANFDFQEAAKDGLKLGLGVGVAPGILYCALKFYTENQGPHFMKSLTDIKTIGQTFILMTRIFGISTLAGMIVGITPPVIGSIKSNFKYWVRNGK